MGAQNQDWLNAFVSRIAAQIGSGSAGQFEMFPETHTTGAWEFPTRHPMVKNPDGSSSNVVMSSFTFTEGGKDKTYVIPTMVDGIPLKNKDAVALARKHGMEKYPVFDSVPEAESWIQKNHGNIIPKGY
jgi:hypothetical protein